MIPEIGQFALILGLVFALVQTVLPLAGAHRGIASWVAVAKPAARIQLLFVGISFACLTWSFLTHDFSVKYVAMNSNTSCRPCICFQLYGVRMKGHCCFGRWYCPSGLPLSVYSAAAFRQLC